MNLQTFLTLAEKNAPDIEAIISVIGPNVGIPALIALTPHVVSIIQTLEGTSAAANPFLTLAAKNAADIEAVISAIGAKVSVPSLLSLTPHVAAIVQTLSGTPATAAAA